MPSRVSIVAAPEGFGKSTMVRSLACDRLAIVDVRPDCTFERFVGDLVRNVAPLAHGISRSLSKVYARLAEREDGPAALAAWFCRYLAEADAVVAVDGIDAVGDVGVAGFLQAAIANSPRGVRWLLVGRDAARLRDFVVPGETPTEFDEDYLRLTFPELRRLSRRIAPSHTGGQLFAIARKAAGSISRAVFLLRCMHFGIAEAADSTTSFDQILERCFASLSENERLETMAGILLEDGGGVEEGTLAREVSSVASRLRTTAPHLFEAGDARLQACFRGRLRREIRTLMATNRTALFVRAGDALEANGDTASAIALYCAVDAVDRLLAVVERRGGGVLEGEQMPVLRQAIALMPQDVRENHPLVIALRAVDAAYRDEHAESIALFERALELSEPGDREQSIRYWYASSRIVAGDVVLVQRMLRPSVDFFRCRPQLRAAMMAMLGVSWSMAGDARRARNWVDRARLVGDSCGDDALSARIYQQAAYVAWRAGSIDDAHQFGLRAVGYAESCGWPHVAAITYSILYHIAAERGSHDLAGAYARRLADNAARAGNAFLHYFAVAACYEYEVERCNLPAIAAVRAEFAQLDADSAQAATARPGLPAQALEIAWDGRFADAFAHVEPLMDAYEAAPPSAPANRTYCESNAFSAAAVYAAAAGSVADANRALRLYRAAASAETREANVVRARIEEALALRLLSREREAKLVLRSVLGSLPASRTRLRAYAELVATLVESPETSGESSRVHLEEELFANGWGGLARLIRSIVAGSRAGRESFVRRNRAIG